MFTIRRFSIPVIVCGLLAAGSTAQAAFNFTSQNRSVFGNTHGNLGGTSQTISAPNFGVFDQTVDVSHPTYGGIAHQHQHSELLPDQIIVSGDADVFRPAMVGTGIADAVSTCEIQFTLATTTAASLFFANTTEGGSPAWFGQLHLSNTTTTFANFNPFFSGGSGSQTFNYTLPAGTSPSKRITPPAITALTTAKCRASPRSSPSPSRRARCSASPPPSRSCRVVAAGGAASMEEDKRAVR